MTGSELAGWELALVALIFFVAGAAKGLLGIGLPTIAISLMSQVLDPRLAVLLTLGPILMTNLQQMIRAGGTLSALRRYAPFWVTLGICIAASATFAQGLSPRALLIAMAAVVIVFTIAQLWLDPPPLPARFHTPAQIVAGAVAGLMGGVTAIWGPPVLIFLIAARVSKEEFVRAMGIILTLGAIPLVAAYAAHGSFRGSIAAISFALTIPAMLGFALGERFRHRIDPARFQRLVLWMFLLLGANMLRRAMAM